MPGVRRKSICSLIEEAGTHSFVRTLHTRWMTLTTIPVRSCKPWYDMHAIWRSHAPGSKVDDLLDSSCMLPAMALLEAPCMHHLAYRSSPDLMTGLRVFVLFFPTGLSR